MRRLPQRKDKNLLVGANTADDAGVYRLSHKLALVQTVDFFTPIVDDPFWYGQIAAANSLSDVYAMGGRPLTALNILGVPEDKVPPEMIREILRGGALKTREAGCVLVGGHTIRNPEPIYGLSVTGTVSPKRLITNSQAQPGDWLVLTKPLGTGIITTAIKRGLARPADIKRAIRQMARLNAIGADLGEAGLVRAGTDVTGFGLVGHLASLCRASRVGAEIFWRSVPPISAAVLALIRAGCVPGGTRANFENTQDVVEWGNTPEEWRWLLADAQTSGGLLLCVPPHKLRPVLRALQKHRSVAAAVLGHIVAARSGATGRIRVVSGEASGTARPKPA